MDDVGISRALMDITYPADVAEANPGDASSRHDVEIDGNVIGM